MSLLDTETRVPDHALASVGELRALARRVDEALERLTRPLAIEAVRQVLNEAGIAAARQGVTNALRGLEDAQAKRREAVMLERAAKEAYEDAVAEAAWEVESELVSEGTKTFFVDSAGARHQLTATERPKWRVERARRHPSVIAAVEGLRRAEQQSLAAGDAVDLAKRRFEAAQRDVDAAIAHLQVARMALSTRSVE